MFTFRICFFLLFLIRSLKSTDFDLENIKNFDDDDFEDSGISEGSGFKLMAAPVNSDCSGAIEMRLGKEFIFNNSGSSSGPSTNCASVDKTLWYYYEVQLDGQLIVNNPLTFPGLILAAYKSDACPTDLASTIRCTSGGYFIIPVTTGEKYYFTVSSSSGISGAASINVDGSPNSLDTAIIISDDVIYAGSNTNVYISAAQSNFYTLNLTCGDKTFPQNNVLSGYDYKFPVPADYLGSCNFNLSNMPVSITNAPPKYVQSLVLVTFNLPTSGQSIVHGVEFPIELLANEAIPDVQLTVKQKCGNLDETSYAPVNVNQTFYGTLPLEYSGSCDLYTLLTDSYSPAAVSVTATKGSLSISTNNGSQFLAGDSISTTIQATPPGVFQVKLNCPDSGSYIQSGFSSSDASKDFVIEDYSYGNACLFTVLNYSTTVYNDANTLTLEVIQPINFTSPTQNEVFNVMNGNPKPTFSLGASAFILNNRLSVTQDCFDGGVFTYTNINIDQEYVADQTPDNFIGQCIFSSAASGLYTASNPNVTVIFTDATLSIVSPENGQDVKAGTKSTLRIEADPVDPNDAFSCIFTPSDAQSDPYVITGITANVDYQMYIPNYLIGFYIFSINKYPSIYPTPTSIILIVDQQLSLTSPQSGYVNPLVPIEFLVSTNPSSANLPVKLTVSCLSQSSGPFTVYTNIVFSYVNTLNLTGPCVVTCDPEVLGYLIPFSPVSINMIVILAFTSVPDQVVNGQKFSLKISSISTDYVPVTISLKMDCGSVTQIFNNVTINAPVILDLNIDVTGLGPFKCELTNLPNASFNTISSNITMLIPLSQQQQAEVAKSFSFSGEF